MASRRIASLALVNVAASGLDLPIEIPLEQEEPVSIVKTDDSLKLQWDFKRDRTRSMWSAWLSSPRGSSRTRGVPFLQLEFLRTTEHDKQVRLDFCRERFELFLRLARADFFSIDHWHHKGYLTSKYAPDTRSYSIDDTVRVLIPLLNQKLRDYFWDQLMLFAFQADDTRSVHTPDSNEEWQRILMKKKEIVASTHYLYTALSYYSKALAETPVGSDRAVVEATIALEALVTDEEEKAEIQYKLARRVASLVEDNPPSQKSAFDLLKRFYDLRSKIVHGSTKALVLGEELKPELAQFLEYTRMCLLYFLALRDMPKKDILASLDYGIFDLHEPAKVKHKAQSFWGKDSWPKLLRQRR